MRPPPSQQITGDLGLFSVGAVRGDAWTPIGGCGIHCGNGVHYRTDFRADRRGVGSHSSVVVSTVAIAAGYSGEDSKANDETEEPWPFPS